jgi:hypothetical protein
MRRERKRQETERRFAVRQERLRERRQRKTSPGGLPAMTGDGPGNRRATEGMKHQVAGFLSASET